MITFLKTLTIYISNIDRLKCIEERNSIKNKLTSVNYTINKINTDAMNGDPVFNVKTNNWEYSINVSVPEDFR